MIDNFNLEVFRAKTHFDLRHNSLSAENWEKTIALATNSNWVRGSADLADCYNRDHKLCISVKTRLVYPQIRKRIANRDFISNPDYFHFGGLKFDEGDLDNIHTVSGRCSIPGLDEHQSPAEDIGKAALDRYEKFEKASLKKFSCDDTVDIVIIHGLSHDHKKYLLRVMFFTHKLNPVVEWHDIKYSGPRTKYKGNRAMIIGYDQHGPHIGRISNLGRQQTCMLRFYRKSEAIKIIDTEIPNPVSEKFDLENELKFLHP